jgi:hypothetical protein
VCLRPGHIANICWYRFDEEYIPEHKTAVVASTSNAQDSNWYLDLGATDHIIGELDKLTMHDRYRGSDQVRAANGMGMHINLIGHFVIPTPYHPLHLKNVLHVPRAHKHLVYAHQFNLDNHTFIELHPHCFLIKDQVMRKVLLRGPCSRVVSHPIPPSTITSEVCHVIKDNNLSCSGFENNGSVCDVCMKAKAHNYPIPSLPVEHRLL